MIKKLLSIIFALATAAQAASFDNATSLPPPLSPAPQQSEAAQLVAGMLARYHYKALPLDDAMSEKIFDQYLKSLDSEKLFFVQSDIDQLAGFRTRLDNAIGDGDLSGPFIFFNRYVERASERFSYARALLRQGFDFGQQETYQYERSKAPWPKSEEEMRDLWRKRVKNDWLRLKLAGKDDPTIVETLDKRYDHFQKRIARTKSEDAFQIFMNAYTTAVEPHTNYMGPRAAEDFNISMKLSLVGIGAVLADKDEYVTIRELIAGGPAALSGQLQVGDRIVGVAQGPDGAITDVLGWRLDDTVALIRGAADSSVVLDILPANAGPDAPRQLVSLVRKKIALEDQAAKKSVISAPEGDAIRRIGVITLPSFYEDFDARRKGRPGFKSASGDVARLLEELKAEKVDAVLIDLRNNGGGSLLEAVELTGLFIGKGPVVQQRDAEGEMDVLSNKTSRIAWDGPLGVLINRGSASASEIFAAAIQDYGRGLVIGEPSFGKGTVQTMVNLDELAKNEKPQFGELKFTVAQFFRVNGGTTQLRGVIPDVSFPTAADMENSGESSFGNALPWMQVAPADYRPTAHRKPPVSLLLTRLAVRQKNDKDFLCLQDEVAELKRRNTRREISLNEAERRQERADQEARLASCEAWRRSGKGDNMARQDDSSPEKNRAFREDDGLHANERNIAADLAEEKARKDAKDVLLVEAAHILGNEVDLLEQAASPSATTNAGSPLFSGQLQGAGKDRAGAL